MSLENDFRIIASFKDGHAAAGIHGRHYLVVVNRRTGERFDYVGPAQIDAALIAQMEAYFADRPFGPGHPPALAEDELINHWTASPEKSGEFIYNRLTFLTNLLLLGCRNKHRHPQRRQRK